MMDDWRQRGNGSMFKSEFVERRNQDEVDRGKGKVERGDEFRHRREGNQQVVGSRLSKARGGGEGKRLGMFASSGIRLGDGRNQVGERGKLAGTMGRK